MPAKRFFILSFLVAAAFLTVIVGCEGPEGPQGPPGPAQVYIVGWIKNNGGDYLTGMSLVETYNLPEIPHVMINDTQIHYDPGPPPVPAIPLRFIDYDLPIVAGDSAKLSVSYTRLDGYPGIAQANIMMPGPFEIILPDTSFDTLAVGDSLIFRWTSSEGVDVYLIDFYLHYSFADTADSMRMFYQSFDSLMADTSIIFPTTQLFPDLGEIDSIVYSSGRFHLWAINGPIQEGEQGNVTGDGFGFFCGWTRGGYFSFYVNGSQSSISEIVEPPNPMQNFYR